MQCVTSRDHLRAGWSEAGDGGAGDADALRRRHDAEFSDGREQQRTRVEFKPEAALAITGHPVGV